MNTYNLNELELGIAELPDGRLKNAFKEQERWHYPFTVHTANYRCIWTAVNGIFSLHTPLIRNTSPVRR